MLTINFIYRKLKERALGSVCLHQVNGIEVGIKVSSSTMILVVVFFVTCVLI